MIPATTTRAVATIVAMTDLERCTAAVLGVSGVGTAGEADAGAGIVVVGVVPAPGVDDVDAADAGRGGNTGAGIGVVARSAGLAELPCTSAD